MTNHTQNETKRARERREKESLLNLSPLTSRESKALLVIKNLSWRKGYMGVTNSYLLKMYPLIFSSLRTLGRVLHTLESYELIYRHTTFCPLRERSHRKVFHKDTFKAFETLKLKALVPFLSSYFDALYLVKEISGNRRYNSNVANLCPKSKVDISSWDLGTESFESEFVLSKMQSYKLQFNDYRPKTTQDHKDITPDDLSIQAELTVKNHSAQEHRDTQPIEFSRAAEQSMQKKETNCCKKTPDRAKCPIEEEQISLSYTISDCNSPSKSTYPFFSFDCIEHKDTDTSTLFIDLTDEDKDNRSLNPNSSDCNSPSKSIEDTLSNTHIKITKRPQSYPETDDFVYEQKDYEVQHYNICDHIHKEDSEFTNYRLMCLTFPEFSPFMQSLEQTKRSLVMQYLYSPAFTKFYHLAYKGCIKNVIGYIINLLNKNLLLKEIVRSRKNEMDSRRGSHARQCGLQHQNERMERRIRQPIVFPVEAHYR